MKVFVLSWLLLIRTSSAFVQAPTPTWKFVNHRMAIPGKDGIDGTTTTIMSSNRRGWILGMAASFLIGTLIPQVAMAIPMVTADEFDIILRDSPFSIQVVEFSGPKSETVTVRLVDGTIFGIQGVVESPTDPRSPLKVAAACRENNVKTKFVELESFLSTMPKKKMYTNQRVQEAQAKERERQLRMQQDEEERLAELRRMGID